MWSLTWPGMTDKTRFVIEALDSGCPFPGGYIAASHADADIDRTSMEAFNAPSLTLDEARLSSGEVFVNGQHDPMNRPKPIARAYVDVTPEAAPVMDFLATFDPGAEWEPFSKWTDNNAFIFRNSKWAIDTSGCTDNFNVRAAPRPIRARFRGRRLELQREHDAAQCPDPDPALLTPP